MKIFCVYVNIATLKAGGNNEKWGEMQDKLQYKGDACHIFCVMDTKLERQKISLRRWPVAMWLEGVNMLEGVDSHTLLHLTLLYRMSVSPSVCLSICPSVRQSVHPSVCSHLSVRLFVRLSVCSSVYPSVRPEKSPLDQKSLSVTFCLPTGAALRRSQKEAEFQLYMPAEELYFKFGNLKDYAIAKLTHTKMKFVSNY